MARKPEEDFEDEEEFEEEEQPKSHLERKLERLDKQLDRLYDELEKEEPGTPRYHALSMNIEELTRTMENLESSETERQNRQESMERTKDAKEEKWMRRIQTAGSIAGAFFGPIAVEVVRQRGSDRRTERITQYEDDGHIVTTKAIKFIDK